MTTSVGPDGIDVSGYGWTNQSTTFNSNKSLESYGAAASGIINPAERYGYSAWSCDPALAIGTAPSVSGVTFVVAVYVPQSFSCVNIDWVQVSGTPNITLALWPSTAPAGTAIPLAWTAATAAVVATGAAPVNTLTWTGSSSPTSVSLTGGQTYLVTLAGSTTGAVAAAVTESLGAANANAGNALYSATTTYRAATLGTQLATVTSSSTFGTSTLSADLVWVGLH
jgi:hypothetical protein